MMCFFRLLVVAAAVLLAATGHALAQSTPNLTAGGAVFGRTAAQWNSYFGAKADAVGGTLRNPKLIGADVQVSNVTSATINKVTIVPPATFATLAINDGKTVTDTSAVGAKLLLGDPGGGFTGYPGAACTNQALTTLGTGGAGTCTSITDAFLSGTIGLAHGGTGASTAAAARTNLGVGTGDSPTFAATSQGTLALTGSFPLIEWIGAGGYWVSALDTANTPTLSDLVLAFKCDAVGCPSGAGRDQIYDNNNQHGLWSAPAVAAGGTGYVNGETITLNLGCTVNPTVIVTNQSGGVIQSGGIAIWDLGGSGRCLTHVVASGVTGTASLSGTGATFNVTDGLYAPNPPTLALGGAWTGGGIAIGRRPMVETIQAYSDRASMGGLRIADNGNTGPLLETTLSDLTTATARIDKDGTIRGFRNANTLQTMLRLDNAHASGAGGQISFEQGAISIHQVRSFFDGVHWQLGLGYNNTMVLKLRDDNLAEFTGHLKVEGVTSTGAAGTGKFVFDTNPTINNPSIVGTTTNDDACVGCVGEVRSVKVTLGSSTVTITIASPGVITWTGHGLTCGSAVFFGTTGALPTGITSGATYYITCGASLLTNTFQISTTIANAIAGTSINTSGTQSGTQSAVSGANLSNNTLIDIAGLQLTAGQWNCSGSIVSNPDGTTTITSFGGSINDAALTYLPTGKGNGKFFLGGPLTTGTGVAGTLAGTAYKLASTSTLYLNALSAFAVSTMGAGGRVECTRTR